MNPLNLPRCAILVAVFAAGSGIASAGTVLEYEISGECAMEFDRMSLDGLHARIDMTIDGMRMSTIFDDEEQLMHQLMHDTKNRMTLESDDDAVDFQGDVGKSSLIAANKQAESITGISTADMMADYRASQIAACPEMAQIGFGDADYGEAATRCAEKMTSQAMQDPAQRRSAIGALIKDRKSSNRTSAPARSNAPRNPATQPAYITTRTQSDLGSEEIAGQTCSIEREMRGDTLLREQCLNGIETLGLAPSAVRRLKRIVKVGEGMGAGIESMQPDHADESTRPASIALRRTCYRNGTATGSARLRIQRDAAIDSALFDVPADYSTFDVDPTRNASQEPTDGLQELMRKRNK